MHSVQAVSFAHSYSTPHSIVAGLLIAVTALLLLRSSASADSGPSAPICESVFDPDAEYPLLSELAGPEVSGEPGVLLYLQPERGVVELGGCLYELDRPLEIDFAGYDMVSILLELHGEASGDNTLFVSTDDVVETHTFARPEAVVTISPGVEMGFELVVPGQHAPTVPVVVVVDKPIDDGPPPQ